MDALEVRNYWERNAPAWTRLAREGWDVYRDAVNTPGFLSMLPCVEGMWGLDLGCGEGNNTRLLASSCGASMCGIDISRTFIGFARDRERIEPLGIRYVIGDAHRLPFASGKFDFATAFMSLMDMPEPDAVLADAWRILRPGGFLQFSITHPCFTPPYRRHIRDKAGNSVAIEVARYFDSTEGEVERWMFSAAPPEVKRELRPFEVPRFHRPLSDWLNSIADAGFLLERTGEPRADEELARRLPVVADTRVVAYFLHLRCRKPR